MLKQWQAICRELAPEPADFYSGCRKILRNRAFDISLGDTLKIKDCGFTKVKLTLLRKLYLHTESRDMALELWDRRMQQGKYGSVGFTTYNHLLKADPTKKSKRASVMGPCLQSVVLTLGPKNVPEVNVFYRTTELFKKFPADLVFLRETLLDGFELPEDINIHFSFANVTCHPMYIGNVLLFEKDPAKRLHSWRRKDKRFWEWSGKWMARYIIPEYGRGIAKFAQALRVQKDMLERFDPDKMDALRDYLREHEFGYGKPLEGDDDDE